ncbi:hypothetical protein J4E86_004858 [Alternaria arbusti]|uniref:uncharacterized protein n=1 Tax=Alternaria arbusti TaxID=232088 RepID=UPI00221FE65D|nr:uncharacterized protein J4E86_004858 [Alternaria arbusti]KAI4957719.1 hypothetical protein J4E86_004858 [Alternaria arbusti]
MDPATTKVILGLHREDLNAALQSLSKTSPDDREGAAFAAFRNQLLGEWNKLHDAVFTLIIVREDSAVREAFTQHSSEAQQVDRNYEMACKFAGLPVPQRPAVTNDHGTHRIAADKQIEDVNGKTLAQEASRFSSVGTQTAPTKTKPPAGNSWWPALSLNSFKRARVDDADNEDKNSPTPSTHEPTLKKRAAYDEPATLREEYDGRTKRIKLGPEACTTPTNATANVASPNTIGLCQADMDVKKLMDVAKEKQWQTCPNCNEMVELKGGCLHITYMPLPTPLLLPVPGAMAYMQLRKECAPHC